MTYRTIINDSLKLPEKRVLITGGIGDFLVIDKFVDDEEWGSIKTCINGGCYASGIWGLLNKIPTFKPEHRLSFWDFQARNRCMGVTHRLRYARLNGIVHFNFWRLLGPIANKKRHFNGSTFLNRDNGCSLTKFDLPADFVCVCPWTCSVGKHNPRNFSATDWGCVYRLLENESLTGVLLGHPRRNFEHPLLTNLTGQTTILESIEILKRSVGYLGIDSYLSVLAPMLDFDLLAVKTIAANVWSHKHVYYAGAIKPCSKFLTRNINWLFRPTIL